VKIVYRHWRFDYDPETGVAIVERRPVPGNTSRFDGRDDSGWVVSDVEHFPMGLSTDQFLDALDDLAAGRFLS